MKTVIDKKTWSRYEHFKFFSSFKEPYWGLTENVDCTKLYKFVQQENLHFYSAYLFLIIRAVNEVKEFRMRYSDTEVYEYNKISVSPTVLRADKTFGFSYVDYQESYEIFQQNLIRETKFVEGLSGLNLGEYRDDVIHFSALPWFSFTSLSHARSLEFSDSCPKISVGKITNYGDQIVMPVSVHVNHAMVDGYHMHLLFKNMNELFYQPQKFLI